MAIVGGIRAAARHERGWTLIVQGAIGVIVGILILVYPSITTVILLYIIGAWAVLTGIFQITAAIQTGSALLGVTGAVSIIFGIVLVGHPSPA